MRLSVVICNYNTRDMLTRSLGSLQQTLGDLTHEIIVVDNASKDGSAAMVRASFPGVKLIEPGANRWFTGGNNLGMRAAQGDYVWILNPDTVIHPHAAQTMVAYLDTHPNAGAVTSRMVFQDSRLQRNCSRLATYLDLLLGYTFLGMLLRPWRHPRRRVMWYVEWDRESDRAVEVAPGSNLLVRRAILDQIGHFDEKLKLYFPEDDLCYRIRATGCDVVYVAGATITHDEHASTSQVQRLATHVYFNDLITFTRKYYGRARAWLLATLIIPTRTVMLIAQSLKKRR
ncbi:MAG: glycosyltransferase family 2 protein [Chloroflexi bacterium]|nr:MAG: glycosyltransferase family 2 protein [Chloroflexota bacterium]